jgi:hypothetical protein
LSKLVDKFSTSCAIQVREKIGKQHGNLKKLRGKLDCPQRVMYKSKKYALMPLPAAAGDTKLHNRSVAL